MEETILLNLEINQADAEKDLIAVNKAIIANKESQTELNKAYKDGTITQEEYVKESVRIQQNVKQETEQRKSLQKVLETNAGSVDRLRVVNAQLVKERNKVDISTEKGIRLVNKYNDEINKNNKLIEKNSSTLEKQKFNIGNYASALDVVIPGTEKFVGSITSLGGALGGTIGAIQKTGFSLQTLNTIPVVALISSLITVFDVLKNSMDLVNNEFIRTFDFLQKQKDAIDRLKKSTDEYIGTLENQNDILEALGGNQITIIENEQKANTLRQNESNAVIKSLKDEIILLGNRTALAGNWSKLTKEQFDRQVSLQREIDASGKTEAEFLELKKQELATSQRALVDLQNQSTILSIRLNQERKAQDESLKKEREKLDLEKKRREEFDKRAKDFVAGRSFEDITDDDEIQKMLDRDAPARKRQFDELERREIAERDFNESLKVVITEREQIYLDDANAYADAQKKKEQADIALLNATAGVFASLSSLAQEGSDEQKGLALISIAADTAAAIAGAAANSQDLLYPANLAAMASSIAAILSAVAQAKQIFASPEGFAEGGYTGDGRKHEIAGAVHKGEYVAPQKVMAMPQATPHIAALESMRLKGYADGGFVTNTATADSQSALLIANTIAKLPPPIVDVKEVTRVQKRIQVKEALSTF